MFYECKSLNKFYLSQEDFKSEDTLKKGENIETINTFYPDEFNNQLFNELYDSNKTKKSQRKFIAMKI